MAAKITTAQIRKIHMLAKERGMDGELLHLYISNQIKKDSISNLSVREAIIVIDSLSGKKTGEMMATKKQVWKIEQQVLALGWKTENGMVDRNRLNSFLKDRFSVEHPKWLTKRGASDVIEALKAMLEREGEKYGMQVQ